MLLNLHKKYELPVCIRQCHEQIPANVASDLFLSIQQTVCRHVAIKKCQFYFKILCTIVQHIFTVPIVLRFVCLQSVYSQ